MRLGYCCINLSVNDDKKKKDQLSVNRSMTKSTFLQKGLSYVSELVIKNLDDTKSIIEWNIKNGIEVYRMSSDSFPMMTVPHKNELGEDKIGYEFNELPNYELIKLKLKEIGKLVIESGIRVGYHPGPFNVLGSVNDSVVDKTIIELNKHAEILDLMGLPSNNYYYINIHIGNSKPSKSESMSKFCLNFNRLSESCKKRLTVENDDKESMFSVKDLYEGIYEKIGIPIVFDYHHHEFGPKDQSEEEALKMALSTWVDERPLLHKSSSRTIEDSTATKTSHADYIYEKVNTYGFDFDLELECKMKDKALFDYISKFS